MRTTSLAVLVLMWNVVWSSAQADPPKLPAAVVSLSEAPTNAWVRIAQSSTGAREQPIFVYAPNIKRFVMASGYQANGGVVPRHYDTEEFDLTTVRWTNAYPAAVAAGRPVSGPVGKEYSEQRVEQGSHGEKEIHYNDGDYQRLGAGGQWLETRGYHQFCYASGNGRIYVYMHGQTWCYDPVRRTWEDLKAEPAPTCRVWGAMCYDPVNREILHSGGDGGSDQVGTWVYSIEDNAWQRRQFGSPACKRLRTTARALAWQATALVGAAANRFTISETTVEAKVPLDAQAKSLAASAEKLAGEVKSAELSAIEKPAAAVARKRLESIVIATEAVAPQLHGPIGPATLENLRRIREQCDQVADALASEPPPRARSQMAYDPEHRQIVLFGGDALDHVLSDTWIYDCTTKTWQQRFPKVCPKPRAGHILAWLPKAKRIVLAGGYSRQWLAQEVWAYDVATDNWSLLLHLPLVGEEYNRQWFSQNCPRVTARGIQSGAVNEDDVLVCLGSQGERGLVTWACKVDPQQAIEIEDHGGAPGDYTFNRIDPAEWEKVAQPDAEATQRFFDEMPVNQWTALKFPKYAPGATNRWGTTAYDVDRHQLLLWGGGHATSKENDVAHYSVRGNCWTIGYHPDDPIEDVYAEQPTPLSFHDRVHVPVHAYKAYCYDPTAHKMFYFDRAYDPAVREWLPAAFPGLSHRGPMHSHMEPTPAGAVTFSEKGLFRFDAKENRWNKLPWEGPRPEGIWCDGHGLCYDSKRDCLWLATDKEIYRYDMVSGKARKTTPDKPKALGQYLFWGEEAYLPEADLVLLMNLFKRSDGRLGSIAWDPDEGRFYWVDLAFVENGKRVQFKEPPFSWSDAMRHDPQLRLTLLNQSSARKVWALKFDRKTARLTRLE